MRWTASLAGPIVRHPSLWPTALRQMRRLAPTRWWLRSPFLPIPSPDYLHFRLVTMYGGQGESEHTAEDLVTWLKWCRAWPEMSR
jgi:hypothetical protein